MTRDFSAARKPDREHRPERDRHLAEDVAGRALADDPVEPVDGLDRLDAALEHGEERALVALLRRVLPGSRVMSAATRESRSRSAASSSAKTAMRCYLLRRDQLGYSRSESSRSSRTGTLVTRPSSTRNGATSKRGGGSLLLARAPFEHHARDDERRDHAGHDGPDDLRLLTRVRRALPAPLPRPRRGRRGASRTIWRAPRAPSRCPRGSRSPDARAPWPRPLHSRRTLPSDRVSRPWPRRPRQA